MGWMNGSITKECSSICFLASLGRDRERNNTTGKGRKRCEKMLRTSEKNGNMKKWCDSTFPTSRRTRVISNVWPGNTFEETCGGSIYEALECSGTSRADKIVFDLERERLCLNPAICDVVSTRAISSGRPITLNRKMNFAVSFCLHSESGLPVC